MLRVTLSIAILCYVFALSSASVCVVSFWSEWGSCVGNCQFALRVRNRNVIRPPFPERTPDGRLAIRPCPSLYQVQTCIPPPCLFPANRNETAVNSLGSESNDPAAVSVQKAVDVEPEQARVDKLPQNSEITANDAVPTARTSTDGPAENATQPTTASGNRVGGVAIVKEVGVEKEAVVAAALDANKGRASVVEMTSSKPSADIERFPQPGVETTVTVDVSDPEPVKAEEPSTSAAPSTTTVVTGQSAETVAALDSSSNATVADNRTAATSPASSASTQPPTATTEQAIKDDKLAVSTIAPATNETVLSTTIPDNKPARRRNTKPCGVEGGNQRCCRLAPRTECPDGGKPQSVMRWSRMAANGECHSYNYAYCGIDIELEEAPIKFEQNCYDLCFTDEEKVNLGIFRDGQFQFRDGFRVTA